MSNKLAKEPISIKGKPMGRHAAIIGTLLLTLLLGNACYRTESSTLLRVGLGLMSLGSAGLLLISLRQRFCPPLFRISAGQLEIANWMGGLTTPVSNILKVDHTPDGLCLAFKDTAMVQAGEMAIRLLEKRHEQSGYHVTFPRSVFTSEKAEQLKDVLGCRHGIY